MSEPVTGTEAIRQRVWSRWKRGHLSRTAEDLEIRASALEAFAEGKGELPPAQLQLLTKEFFPYHTEFDPVTYRLISTRARAGEVHGAVEAF